MPSISPRWILKTTEDGQWKWRSHTLKQPSMPAFKLRRFRECLNELQRKLQNDQ